MLCFSASAPGPRWGTFPDLLNFAAQPLTLVGATDQVNLTDYCYGHG